MRENTHENQRGVQVSIVFLDKVTVMLGGFAFELVIEVVAGAVGRSRHGILQTRREQRGHKMASGDG